MTDDDVLAAMERYGGSFIHALAQCYRTADDGNRRTVRQAFSTYWMQYADLAERAEPRKDAEPPKPRGPKPTFPENIVTISDQPVKESKR